MTRLDHREAQEHPPPSAGERIFSPVRAAIVLALLIAGFIVISFGSRWYFDDAFITFRYARHLAEGHGLVWNVVDATPVEGSTSLGWTAMNAVAIRLGLHPLFASHAAGILSGVLALVLVYIAGRHVLGLSRGWALFGPAMLLLQRQWILSGVSGMETRAATLLLFAATVCFIRELSSDRPRGFGSGALFLAATFMRPEAPLMHLAAGAGALAVKRSVPVLRATIESGSVHLVGLGLLTLWRIEYFGQLLPNTFYVKVEMLQLDRGIPYVMQFLLQSGAWSWMPLLLFALPLLKRRNGVAVGVLAMQTVAWLGWLAAFGGGRWEFRLADPVLPVIALWVAISLATLASTAFSIPRIRYSLVAVAAAFVLVSQGRSLIVPFRSFGHVISAEQSHRAARSIREEGRLLSRYLGPEDRIATGWAGTIPYETRAWHFDPFGLNDPEIARRPFEDEATVFHQRHATWGDIVDHRVMFCDVFNHFIENEPYDDSKQRMVVPWVEDGVPVFSVRLPDGLYWIFTSAVSRLELEAWLHGRDLEIHSMKSLPPGMPRW